MSVQGSSYIARFHFYTYKKPYRKKKIKKENQKAHNLRKWKSYHFVFAKTQKKLRRRLLADLSCLFTASASEMAAREEREGGSEGEQSSLIYKQ